MAMLDRYKRRGGFVQLLNLIESSPSQKRENFLNLISQESKIWEEEIRKRILTFERVLTWNPQYLSEIFTRIQPMNLAVAFFNSSPELIKKSFSELSPSLVKKIELSNSERQPSNAEIFTCQIKILEETRQLIQKGIIKLDKVDPDLFIHEKIEEILAEKETQSSNTTALNTSSTSSETSQSSVFESNKNQHANGPTLNLVQTNADKGNFDEDIKKVNELSKDLLDTTIKRTDNELFIKQIHQELIGMKSKMERIQQENLNLKKEIESMKLHDQKNKDEAVALKKEIQSLRSEANLAKSKLEQIKKIA